MEKHTQNLILLAVLFFLSGTVALMYEVFWFRQMRFLFGSTALAVSLVLTAFFMGLAFGAKFFGTKADKIKNPLLIYGFLELGIALSAVFYFFLLPSYYALYGWLAPFLNFPSLSFLLKFIFGFLVLLPSAWCMGGTLPVISAFFPTEKEKKLSISLLYAVNTLGAAAGAIIAGFFLPRHFGYNVSYSLTIGVSVLISVIALICSRTKKSMGETPAGHSLSEPKEEPLLVSERLLYFFIFCSGFILISLEVLWTIALAQMFANDVYSFSAILIIFLLSLSLGGFIAKKLLFRAKPIALLYVLLTCSGLAVSFSVVILSVLSRNVGLLSASGNFTSYIITLFIVGSAGIFLPVTLAGILFPFLLRFLPEGNAGKLVGLWLFINTLGGAAGALSAGFVIFPIAGLGLSIGIMGGFYFVASFLVRSRNWKRSVMTFALVLIFSIVIPLQFNAVAVEEFETLDKVYYGASGIVSVMTSHPPYYPPGVDDKYIRLNNHYILGGIGAIANEKRQAHLPLLLHENPKRVFVLGMGTGITAGAALHHEIDSLTVAEINPDVIDAAREYFKPYTNGLFDDSRVHIVADDARQYLLSTNNYYDVIIGDLFNPAEAGAGNLYTIEHFTSVKEHLDEDGLFVQWIPLYQLSEDDFRTISTTFLEVFPETQIWRGNFLADRPIVGLVGWKKEVPPLDPGQFISRTKNLGNQDENELLDFLVNVKGLGIQTISPQYKDKIIPFLPTLAERVPFSFYMGSLNSVRENFNDYPLNTDDNALIEFSAGQKKEVFTLSLLEEFSRTLLPQENDSYLQQFNALQRGYVQQGFIYYQSSLQEYNGILKDDENSFAKAEQLFNQYASAMGMAFFEE